MGSQGPPRRPFCLRCSKPTRLCLCGRLKSPPLDNSIPVTILQHSLEKNHPLNSIRVARLGLKNLAVVPVTDVNFQAQLLIRPIDPNRPNSGKSLNFSATHFAVFDDFDRRYVNRVTSEECGNGYHRNPAKKLNLETNLASPTNESLSRSDEDDGIPEPRLKKMDFDHTQECPTIADNGCCREKPDSGKCLNYLATHSADCDDFGRRDVNSVTNGEHGNGCCLSRSKNYRSTSENPSSSLTRSDEDAQTPLQRAQLQSEKLDFDHKQEFPTADNDSINAIFDKYQVSCSSSSLRITIERSAKPDISWVLESPIGRAATSNGFVVKKLQRKQLPGSEEFQDFEEFEIVMPPGSALLFPSGKLAISLDKVDFEVKHLVVLDGTWAKAKRIYHENPWLKLLPHLKLDSGNESLYSEVRHQPKAGCLSTIESIVCALKALGNDMEGLDNLLDVFKSMIGDQRRCKDEKFRAMSLS